MKLTCEGVDVIVASFTFQLILHLAGDGHCSQIPLYYSGGRIAVSRARSPQRILG